MSASSGNPTWRSRTSCLLEEAMCARWGRRCLLALAGLAAVAGVSCSSAERRQYGDVAVGGLYLVADPLAPNWRIEEARLPDGSFSLELTMKTLHGGGAGEASQAVRRRAEVLMQERGFLGYQIERYSEGIDSGMVLNRRVAHARIRLLYQAPPPRG